MSQGEGGERRGRPERRRSREDARERRRSTVSVLPELFRRRQEPTTIHAAAEEARRESETRFSIRKPFSSIYNVAKIRPSLTAYSGIVLAALALGGAQAALTYGLLAMPGVFFKSRWRKASWLLGSAALLAGYPEPITLSIVAMTVIEIVKNIGRELKKPHREDYGGGEH